MSWHISNHTSLSSQETQAQKLSGTYGKSMYWDPVFGKKSQQELKNPPPRVYHSASICRTGTASGMMVIFGGRGGDGTPLNDTWGLRKHRDGRLDWMRAPYRNNSRPTERYQHRSMFVGTLLLIIGGRRQPSRRIDAFGHL
jgi:protein phosphatase